MATIDQGLVTIDAPNLSVAWARAFLAVTAAPPYEVAPLIVSFRVGAKEAPVEEPAIRAALEECLVESGMQEIDTVAGTIFPQSLWQRAKGDRHRLFSDYLRNLPAYVSMAPGKNGRGLYFARLIAFNTDPKTGKCLGTGSLALPDGGNQLEFIIKHLNPGMRRSCFQASIFDPARDHLESPYLGFPCLQHVTFVPNFTTGILQTNAFYANQYVFERAYGNFLGIARLCNFVGREAGLAGDRVTCFIGVEQYGTRPGAGAALGRLRSVAVQHSGTQSRERDANQAMAGG